MIAGERIVVAMSGGVDSSVAAARLVDAGYTVIGVTLHLWDYEERAVGGHGRCCAPEDQYDARRVADALGFSHYTFDRRELFEEQVVSPFVDAYVAGETPSPCTACNRTVKLAELFRLADGLGARLVATGHYARVVRVDDAPPRLAAGADPAKDQSYFLYASPAAWLDRLVFPLGESTKKQVREEALTRRLPGASKGESQELCFVDGGEYASFVAGRAQGRLRPGPIVDEQGRIVGAHEGVHRFTVGQRRGIGVASRDGRPLFVTRVDPESASVHLGGEQALLAESADVVDLSLAQGVRLPIRARVRVRYRHEGDAATIEPSERGARVLFDRPVRAVTRGQTAVFYDGETVLGGGRIASGTPVVTASA